MADEVLKKTKRKTVSTFAMLFSKFSRDGYEQENSSFHHQTKLVNSIPFKTPQIIPISDDIVTTTETISVTLNSQNDLLNSSLNVLLAKCKSMQGRYYDISSCYCSLLLIEKAFSFLDRMPISDTENENCYLNAKKVITDLIKITAEMIHSVHHSNKHQIEHFHASIESTMKDFGETRLPLIKDARLFVFSQLYLTYLEMQENMYWFDQNNHIINQNKAGRKKAADWFIRLKKEIDIFAKNFPSKAVCSAIDVIKALKRKEARVIHANSTEIYEEDIKRISIQKALEVLKEKGIILLEKIIQCPQKYVPAVTIEMIKEAWNDAVCFHYPQEWVLIQAHSDEKNILENFIFSSTVLEYLQEWKDGIKKEFCLQDLNRILLSHEEEEYEEEEQENSSTISDLSNDTEKKASFSIIKSVLLLLFPPRKVIPVCNEVDINTRNGAVKLTFDR